jgi:hypothetical protein
LYIIDPTQEQLNSWYKCHPEIAKYFIQHLPVVHIDKNYYLYFAKTEDWKELHSSLPLWTKVIEKFLNKRYLS